MLWEDSDSFPRQDPRLFHISGADLTLVDDQAADCEENETNLCTCLMFFSATNTTVKFLEEWKNMQKLSPTRNQMAFNRALQKMKRTTNLLSVVLPQNLFPTGKDLKTYISTSQWVHANYLIGYEDKRMFLIKFGADIPMYEDHLRKVCHLHFRL